MFSIDNLRTGKSNLNKWFKSNWVILFFVALLFGSYVPLFHSFQVASQDLITNSHLENNFEGQIWLFLCSDGFKWVTTALLFPIISLFISNTFKIKEKADLQIQKKIDERKQAQWECINLTQKIWKDLLNLSSKLKHYEFTDKDIDKIRMELDEFLISARETVNVWDYNFPELKKQQKNYKLLLLASVNVLYNSERTVAYIIHNYGHIIHKPEDKKITKFEDIEIKDYQALLNTIEYGINYIFQHDILNVFRNYMEIYNYDDDNKKEELKKDLDKIGKLAYKLKKIEILNNNRFSCLKSGCYLYKEVEEHYHNEIEDWFKINPNGNPKDCPISKYYVNLYNIERKYENREFFCTQPPYSKDCMIELAKYLDKKMIHEDLRERTLWKTNYFSNNPQN